MICHANASKEDVLLSVSSTFEFFGKLSAAPLSLFTRSKYMVSRPAFVAALMVPMAASFYLLLIPTKAFVYELANYSSFLRLGNFDLFCSSLDQALQTNPLCLVIKMGKEKIS